MSTSTHPTVSQRISSKVPLRFVTASALFDGHDVSINIMRRMLQQKGVEVIHLGHNRSVEEVLEACLSEDADAVALSSYQGGHMEYFTYLRQSLDQAGASQVRLFGGGGGVIAPFEIEELHLRGITKIYSPEDGRRLGLEGIIADMIEKTAGHRPDLSEIDQKALLDRLGRARGALPATSMKQKYELAQVLTLLEQGHVNSAAAANHVGGPKIWGITGPGGAGKSSLTDELLLRFAQHTPDFRMVLLSIDPSRRKTQGALLGDRIRLTVGVRSQLLVRSMGTRGSGQEINASLKSILSYLRQCALDLVLVETSGVGQSSDAIKELVDQTIYVMTPEYGAATQLEKIELLESADYIVLNKMEKVRAADALRDIKKQYRRNKNLFDTKAVPDEQLPIYATMASRFNDSGINRFFYDLVTQHFSSKLNPKTATPQWQHWGKLSPYSLEASYLIPKERQQYLREMVQAVRKYRADSDQQQQLLEQLEHLEFTAQYLKDHNEQNDQRSTLAAQIALLREKIAPSTLKTLEDFDLARQSLQGGSISYEVRGKTIKLPSTTTSLSGTVLSKVAYPSEQSPGGLYRFCRRANLPGHFPFAAGVFPLKRQDEDPKRQFAGEGGPERTNKRFHFLCKDATSKRLSTAFDSVTLYGEDPGERPDIFGKVGESGVSIATLQDMCDLFAGIDLNDPKTSVSMTINGPAPMMLALYFNAAAKQQSEKLKDPSIFTDPQKRLAVFQSLRGTVQADILKEDQAQNTCIFSLDFAIKMMGDVQEYFCQNQIKNYYSVSISGYHIAEAGANPITQLAFTLANGLTYLEYYLSRGMQVDDICQNLSFFFSNGLDPEYGVLGRVARKLWAVIIKERYNGSEKAQKLKYHIQTSGRSLHAQEMAFNDIRTTLQALLALADNCNSLHTNAYDEAVTTPTEESVRRAMAIQMIINSEFGIAKVDNPWQGSYFFEQLNDLVEDAVLKEFEAISDRGGVLGAMESMYQRGKIQEESHYYESLKDSGEYPIIGVNTFIDPNEAHQVRGEVELIRASTEEKQDQIKRLRAFQQQHQKRAAEELIKLKQVALKGENIFTQLLETVQYCSLGQMTQALYEVGGKYRRNI